MSRPDTSDRPAIENLSLGSSELSTWKEIASYLGVNVRTAQKWEHERGLPVRRAPGARSRVTADRPSVDAWKQRLAYPPTTEERGYLWPLGPNLRVEVRFLGGIVTPVHIDLLRDYLNLVKTALSGPVRR